MMRRVDKRELLRAYEIYVPTEAPLVEQLFRIILVVTVAAFLALGLLLNTIKPLREEFYEQAARLRAQFVVEEPPKVEPPKPEEKPKPKPEVKPIDLTNKPEMAQKEDEIRKQPPAEKVRRVYGLKRVYSTGLGSGGSMADAVIGKYGNTLNKDVDTVKATAQDLKGEVVSVTTITAAPRFRKQVKPVYTPEMIEAKVEGVVKVKVLVDIDGRVKQASALNDLGYGTAKMAMEACLQMEFDPAMRGTEPVAVWITIPIRFVLLG